MKYLFFTFGYQSFGGAASVPIRVCLESQFKVIVNAVQMMEDINDDRKIVQSSSELNG